MKIIKFIGTFLLSFFISGILYSLYSVAKVAVGPLPDILSLIINLIFIALPFLLTFLLYKAFTKP